MANIKTDNSYALTVTAGVISALNKANTKQQKQLASQIMDRLR